MAAAEEHNNGEGHGGTGTGTGSVGLFRSQDWGAVPVSCLPAGLLSKSPVGCPDGDVSEQGVLVYNVCTQGRERVLYRLWICMCAFCISLCIRRMRARAAVLPAACEAGALGEWLLALCCVRKGDLQRAPGLGRLSRGDCRGR